MIRRAAVSLIPLLASVPAAAQAPVQQSGVATAGHVPVFAQNYIIKDGGTAAIPKVQDFGVYGNGGLHSCIVGSSVSISSFNPGSSPHTDLCFTVTQGVVGKITLNSYNGAALAGFDVNINGTDYAFPASGMGTGNVTGPTVSVIGDLAVFNSTNGQLLADGGTAATFGGTVTVFTGTGTITVTTAQKIIVVDKGTPAPTPVVLPAASNWPTCPSSSNSCPIFRIKDGAGNAATYPITVTTADSTTIDGQSSFVQNANYEETDFVLIGTTWSAL